MRSVECGLRNRGRGKKEEEGRGEVRSMKDEIRRRKGEERRKGIKEFVHRSVFAKATPRQVNADWHR